MNTFDPTRDQALKSALQALNDAQPSHGFDARLVEALAEQPEPTHVVALSGQLAAASVSSPGRMGWWPMAAGAGFAVALAVGVAVWMQASPAMPTDLREPDTLSVLSYGVL
jgi:ferric-dicitrate binding protein FerR (iron transport regulator)